jgi:hypothetical protein
MFFRALKQFALTFYVREANHALLYPANVFLSNFIAVARGAVASYVELLWPVMALVAFLAVELGVAFLAEKLSSFADLAVVI